MTHTGLARDKTPEQVGGKQFLKPDILGSQGDEWEEKWGEQYWNLGRASKYADKWGQEGTNVWHERWGEDYDGSGGCFKYTDKVPALCSAHL